MTSAFTLPDDGWSISRNVTKSKFIKTECVHLTKWYQYILSVSLKSGAYYITGQWGEFIKSCYLMLSYTLLAFFSFFSFSFVFVCLFVFRHKICVFIIFISYFDELSNFRNRMLTNQKHELVISHCQRKCMNITKF